MADWYSQVKSEKPPEVPINETTSKTQARENLIRHVLDHAHAGNLAPWVEAVVQGKLDPDFTSSNGNCVLHEAVWRLDYQTVEKLVKEAALPVDLRNATSQTPLALAVARGSYSLIKFFLDKGADIEAADHLGFTPLLSSVLTSQLGAFYVLLHRGANIDVKDNNGCSLVHWAAYKNNVPFLRVLKSLNLSLEATDKLGMTPLHRAAMSNAVHSIEYLLFEEVPLNAKDTKDRTPMQVAVEYSAEASQKVLNMKKPQESLLYRLFSLVFLGYWGLVFVVYLYNVLPHTSHYLLSSLVFNTLVVTMPIVYFVAKLSKPGCIPRETNNTIQKFGDLFELEKFEEIPKPEKICSSCHIERPQRSKHCRLCDTCVPVQDHHCLFLGKCISEQNHRKFLLGLIWQVAGTWLFLYLEWGNLDSQLQESYLSSYVVKALLLLSSQGVLNLCVVIVSVAVLWYSWWYLFLELYAISNALTVNEVLNRHKCKYLFTPFQSIDGTLKLKFKNPFTKGFLHNWMDFLTT